MTTLSRDLSSQPEPRVGHPLRLLILFGLVLVGLVASWWQFDAGNALGGAIVSAVTLALIGALLFHGGAGDGFDEPLTVVSQAPCRVCWAVFPLADMTHGVCRGCTEGNEPLALAHPHEAIAFDRRLTARLESHQQFERRRADDHTDGEAA